MLASGYWYVHQMGRKQYESEKLPLTLTPEQYDNGVNEPIFIQEIFEGPVELKDAIEFVKSDNQRTKLSLMSGDMINYLPARNLKITVDKDAVIRNGIVPESMKDKIVDEIVWRIPDNISYIYKNDLMLLDFMASNNWTRSVYFTSLSDIKNVIDIDKYLHLEGLAHRFMPVEAVDYYKDAGGVYVDGSYELLMSDDISWGNLNHPDVAIDPESRRNILYVKQAYMRLAGSLLSDGRTSDAVAVMDKCIEFFPNDKLPFDRYMLSFVDMYYQASEMEKGDALVNAIAENAVDNLRYYSSLTSKFKTYYSDYIREDLSILQNLVSISNVYKRYQLKLEVEKLFNEQYGNLYMYIK